MKDEDEIRIIVDENNNIIWYKKKKNMKKNDIYRVSSLWIKNSKWEVLLAQRSFKKSHNPWQWWPAVSGTLEKWETYDDNIIKETEEEIWLKVTIDDIQKKDLTKKVWEYTYFGQSYLWIFDLDINKFKIQEEEVEQIKWRSVDELQKRIRENPKMFLSNFWERVEKIL